MFQLLFGSSDNSANIPTHSPSGYRTKDASTYKKLLSNWILLLLHSFFLFVQSAQA